MGWQRRRAGFGELDWNMRGWGGCWNASTGWASLPWGTSRDALRAPLQGWLAGQRVGFAPPGTNQRSPVRWSLRGLQRLRLVLQGARSTAGPYPGRGASPRQQCRAVQCTTRTSLHQCAAYVIQRIGQLTICRFPPPSTSQTTSHGSTQQLNLGMFFD